MMGFLSLSGLGALGTTLALGGALAAVGALVLMYFLKLKRIRRDVSSTFLWRRAVFDMRANSPFQKLRRNLLLFLQLLILIAALLALGRPALKAVVNQGTRYIVLIDNSASMSSTDVPGGRLEQARKAAKKLIGEMSAADSMQIFSFASRPRIVKTMTNDLKALMVAVNSIEPTEERTSFDEPLQLASSLAAGIPNARIVLISDGSGADKAGLEALGAPLDFISVGAMSRNLGVTSLDIRRNVDNPSVGEIFAKISNCFNEPMEAIVSLEIAGQMRDAKKVTIPAETSHAIIFKVSLDAERVAKVSVDVDDDLEVDNHAWIVLEPPSDVHVMLLGQVSPFLRRALQAPGRFRISTISADSKPLIGDTETVVFVGEGVAPTALSRGSYLIFGAVPPGDGFSGAEEVETPIVIDVDNSHPVTSYLELDDLYIAKAKKMQFPAETKVLVDSDRGPLVALSYGSGVRVITVAFNPMDSRWPLRISYPMFVANAINFLAGMGDSRTGKNMRTGDVLVLGGDEEAGSVKVTDPRGVERELRYEESGTVAYGDTSIAGVYQAETDTGAITYAVSLADSAESDTTPAGAISVGESSVASVGAGRQSNRELWRELIIFAVVVLLVEWYIYNRRMYV